MKLQLGYGKGTQEVAVPSTDVRVSSEAAFSGMVT